MVGERNGSQSYASLAISGVIGTGRLKLAPYGRFERVRSQLDGYDESGPTASTLRYGQVTSFQDIGAAGLFASYRMLLDRTSLEPSVRIEARRLRGSSDEQALWLADMPARSSILIDPGASQSQLVGGVGLAVRVRDALSFGVDYRYTADGETYRSESIMATLRAPF
jgi:outer membrane autotransporter protein